MPKYKHSQVNGPNQQRQMALLKSRRDNLRCTRCIPPARTCRRGLSGNFYRSDARRRKWRNRCNLLLHVPARRARQIGGRPLSARRCGALADSERGANGPSSKTEIWRAPDELWRACAAGAPSMPAHRIAPPPACQRQTQPRPPGEEKLLAVLLAGTPLQVGYGTP
ncbi:hypothetical protein MRX96_044242 [Rhipicephalus microplus]